MHVQSLERLSPAQWFYDIRDQLKNHVYARSERAFARGDAVRDALASPTDVLHYQATLRERFIRSLGGLPESPPDLQASVTGEARGDGWRVERILYQSRPDTYVTANLYLPDDIDGPRPAVLFLCGHATEGKTYPEYQAVCQILALSGLVVLAQDPIGQGERLSYHEPALGAPTIDACCPEHDHAGAQCVPIGDSIARYFLHDAMRGLDLLAARPEVDAARIGVTGNSGGGTQSSLLMLADPRLAAAAPGTFIMNRATYMRSGGAQDAEQIWPGFTAAGYDHEDILIAQAPRPVRVLAVTGDFFPIEGTRRTVERCRRVWELFGRGDEVDLAEDRSGHAYTRPLARAAASFFGQHLLGAAAQVDERRVQPLEARQLWCTRSGQVRGDLPGARAVFETNLDRLRGVAAKREAVPAAERRARATEWLRERVARHRTPCALNPRLYREDRLDEMTVTAAIWWSQPDLLGHAFLFRRFDRAGDTLPVTIALWDGGTSCLVPHVRWLRRECEAGRAVMVLDVAGTGALEPHSLHEGYPPEGFYGVIHKLADDLTWLDDSLAALRVHSVLRALDLLAELPGTEGKGVRARAEGRTGTYGRIAAAIDARIERVDVSDPAPPAAEWAASRHYDSHGIKALMIPGMLSVLDLPDLPGTPDG
ncbi:MAG: acetylxylan esterase [Chthonomonadales bacterium]|nr:acetylxylan esterase [Chthonomonadales bacterium]